MTKLSKRPIESKLMGYYVNDLWTAFALMGEKEDIKELFHDLFSHTEYKMFAKRLQIARLLLKGEDYGSIKNVLKVTDRTIAHVSNVLATQGYGFRKADNNLDLLSNKIQNKREEDSKNLQNSFRRRLKKVK